MRPRSGAKLKYLKILISEAVKAFTGYQFSVGRSRAKMIALTFAAIPYVWYDHNFTWKHGGERAIEFFFPNFFVSFFTRS